MHSDKNIEEFISRQQSDKELLAPSFFRVTDQLQEMELISLLEENPQIEVLDTIVSQLKDLIKSLNPRIIFDEKTISERINKHLNGVDPVKYGVWVYYPWLKKVVHLLDAEEFIIVRTNRNKHKITLQEQEILAQKKIGIIGLSVGQSVSLTLAIERGCGELRIADFDVLDLTNLNRIRSGVHNINTKKTVIVAREIAEIDPFLKVTCFNDGITEANIDTFLTKGGKLDLLIDECDSFDIKISSRQKAKELGIPVLMEGSDRCTIDIERFDLEPERPVLHGFVENLDMTMFRSLKTMDERIPYIAPVTGVETLSPRMKASAIEIMSTISTWPQLASAVSYGGGISADIARKILLGELKVSGRFFIDIDDLIHDDDRNTFSAEVPVEAKTTDPEKFIDLNRLNQDGSGDQLDEILVSKLIESANKAPSGGNNQPWLWHYTNDSLHLFLNKPVSGAYLDPEYISSYISLGAAIENLLLESAVNGLSADWRLTPEYFPDHVATFKFHKNYSPTQEEHSLAVQIDQRHTNRKIGIEHALDPASLDDLKALVETNPDTKLNWITKPDSLQMLGEISGNADLFRMFIPAAHEDFVEKEMRWNIEDTTTTGDGIGIHSLDLSNNDQIGLRLMKDKKAVSFLKSINGGSAFKRLSAHQFRNSAAVGLITSKDLSPSGYLKSGIQMEKMWLMAGKMGYQIHPMNVPLIFFYKNNREKQNNLPVELKTKIHQMHETFKEIFKIDDDIAEIFLFRLFKAQSSPIKTIRRPLNKTLTFGTTETTY
jgi:molybdopterin/thiamine biosynthesis adenylyltransferase